MTPPLSIGDEVEITGPCRHGFTEDVGDRFVINRVSDDEKEFTGDCNCRYPASSLRLVPKFKKGDLVEIIGPSPDGTTREIGERFTITQTYEDFSWMSDDCRDCYSDTGRHPYKASSLRLVEELKIGDWVEVISEGYVKGKILQIKALKDSCGQVLAGNIYFGPDSLRKLTPEEIQQHTGTIGYQAQKCNAELEKAKEAMREILAPLVDERLSTIESRLNSLAPSHAELLGDVEALAENAGAIEKRLTSIEKRQREQHERMDRFMQDYREHKDFDFDMHDRIKALEGEMPEVCEGKPDRVICPNARFSPRSKCMFCGNGTDLCHDKLVRSACEYKVLDSVREA